MYKYLSFEVGGKLVEKKTQRIQHVKNKSANLQGEKLFEN